MFGQISGHLMAQWCWHMKLTITDTEQESQGVGGESGGCNFKEMVLSHVVPCQDSTEPEECNTTTPQYVY